MTSDEALAVGLCQLKASFAVLIKAYEEVQRTGQFREPQLAAAALINIDSMVTSLAVAGLDRVGYDGSHVNELLRLGNALLEGSALVENGKEEA